MLILGFKALSGFLSGLNFTTQTTETNKTALRNCRVALSRHRKINSIKEAKNFKCYQRFINKQLLQVSGMCSTAFLNYLSKRSTEIYRAQYADAILV